MDNEAGKKGRMIDKKKAKEQRIMNLMGKSDRKRTGDTPKSNDTKRDIDIKRGTDPKRSTDFKRSTDIKRGTDTKRSTDTKRGADTKRNSDNEREASFLHAGNYRNRSYEKNPESTRRDRPQSGKSFPRRSTSLCPYIGKCGGCQFLDQTYEQQLQIKKDYVIEQIKPYCSLDSIVAMEEPRHYRNKVHAVFGRDHQSNILAGTYIQGTHKIVDVESCLLDNQNADAIIKTIKKLIPSFKIKTYDEDTSYGLLRHVLIRIGKTSGEIMVVLVLASPVLPSKNNFIKVLRKEHPEISTVVLNVNDRQTSVILGNRNVTLYGKGYLEDTLCGKTFRISPSAFYQVNPVQTEKLYQKAIEMAQLTGQETVLDAYCGIGTIGIIASDKAKRVIAVEINRDAVRDAVANMKINKAENITICAEDAGEFMAELAESGEEKVDVVFMDPPRAGSDETFLSALVQLAPEKVVYISCNPETLARDLKFLTEHGYKAKKAVAVDMFPWTSHVETVVGLRRKDL